VQEENQPRFTQKMAVNWILCFNSLLKRLHFRLAPSQKQTFGIHAISTSTCVDLIIIVHCVTLATESLSVELT